MGANYGNIMGLAFSSAAGVTVSSGAASASQTIPVDSSGARPKQVYLQATGYMHIKLTRGAGTATTSDILIGPNTFYVVNCLTFDTISYIQKTVTADLNIIPLEA